MRPDLNDYFFAMARLVSMRATCDRKKVGAIIVTPQRHIIATGYNGSPAGLPHCDEVGHLLENVNGNERCVRTVHAEQNAIAQAAYGGRATQGTRMYCTTKPCLTCAGLIVTAGITHMFFEESTSDDRGWTLLLDAGVISMPRSLMQGDIW